MNRKALLSLAALLLLAPLAAQARQTPPAPPAQTQSPVGFGSTFFLDGDNFLGIHPEEITRENMGRYGLSGEPRGVGVRSVVKGSPAERAGLKEGDVIVRFDGEAVTSLRKLNRLIDEAAAGHTARVRILRGGSEQEVSATLARQQGFMPAFGSFQMPSFDTDAARRMAEELKKRGEDWQLKGDEYRKRLEELQRANPGGAYSLVFGNSRRIGVSTTQLGKQLADYFGVSSGVLVNSVESGSPADKAGIRAGDVITEADGTKIDEATDLSAAINRREEGEVTLTVVRERKQRTVRLTPEKRQPQGFNFSPGARVIAPPPVAVVRAPRAPRAPIAPRMHVTPPARVLRGWSRAL